MAASDPGTDAPPGGRKNPVTAARDRIRDRLEAKGTYSKWVLAAALAGMFATTFPVTILSVSLSDIADEFGSDVTTLTWVITAPMLLSALSLPILGKLGDLYGHRRVFLTGFLLATATSTLTALAWDPLSLIGFRSLAQVIGGATQPTSMALVMLVFAPSERVRAVGYWALVSAGAPAVGLAIGGPLVDLVGWRLIFVVQAGLASSALVLAALILPESNPKRVRFDLQGSLTLAATVGGAMFALGQGPRWGWTHPVIAVALVTVPLGLWRFVRVEQGTDAPLLPLEFLRRRNFTFPLATNFFQGAVYMGGFVLAPLALRDVFGLTATTTATVMLLRTGVYSLSSPVGGRLGQRIGGRSAAVLGMSLLTGAMLVFTVGANAALVGVFAAGLALQGFGAGVARPSLTAALANAVPEEDLGLASALQRMTHQIGNSFGITLLAAAYDDSATAAGFVLPFTIGIGLGLVAVALATFVVTDVHDDDAAAEVGAPAPEPATTP